ncbi:MAG: signal peptide peptidase SppA [Alphaproteobacteria bacterium]|nr:signal peptide peptidase SppA [Alphaproteobacteria bacterium]
MFKFLARCFAVIGFLAVAVCVTGAVVAWYTQKQQQTEPAKVVLSLDFDSPIVEQGDGSPLDLALDESSPVALLDIVRAIDAAKDDPHVVGIVARFGSEQPSLIQAQEIRAALARFKKSGKFTYAYGTSFGDFGSGDRAYYLASAFDNIWLQPVGTVSLTGVGLTDFFGKTALDKAGITADFMRREEYKEFMEDAQRDAFDPAVKVEMQGLVDNLSGQIAAGIADSRKWDAARVANLMAQGPYTADEAQQNGLVTRVAYADQLDDEIDRLAGKDAQQVDVDTYLGYADDGTGGGAQTEVALIYGLGLIADKDVGDGGIAGGHVMGADDIAGAFDDAASDANVKAILFRIDSPGGSPSASETIRRAMIHAEKQGKPVIVSMGGTAASGGYWIAMNGDKIIADPGTLTGSIGVVSGKFALDGLLQKIGVTPDGVRTADNAGMWQMDAPFNPAQRARINALLDETYRAFTDNVAAARKIPLDKMPDIAKGRVWTGEQALPLGLVDQLGGYDVALEDVRQALKLGENDVIDLEPFPAAPTPAERLLKLLHHFGAASSALSSLADTLDDIQAVARPWLGLAALSRHPVAAQMILGDTHE